MAALFGESGGGTSPWVWDDLSGPDSPSSESEATPEEPPEPTVEEKLETSFQEGYARGKKDGETDAHRSFRTVVSTAEAALDEIRGAQAAMLEAVHENTAALAVAVARALIQKEITADHDVIMDLVRQAISSFPLGDALHIRVHPADLALISGLGESNSVGRREVAWVADPSVGRGGCVVEGPEKIMDGRLDLALERVFKAVTDEGGDS